jgi:hypothetical protein
MVAGYVSADVSVESYVKEIIKRYFIIHGTENTSTTRPQKTPSNNIQPTYTPPSSTP